MHSKAWTRQQAIDYYKANTARSAHEIEVEVDRIIAQPGTVPVYKLGELKIRELRSHAERELGSRFDIRAFHDHLLGHGQLPLDLLETSVKAWVTRVRASDPRNYSGTGARRVLRAPAGSGQSTRESTPSCSSPTGRSCP